MPEIIAQSLLTTDIVEISDVYCQGRHAPQTDEEWTTATHLVFPYRGVFVRHLGRDQAVAEANQVLFFNTAEGYRVSHPVPGGDASLSLVITDPLLRELAAGALLRDGSVPAFRRQRLRTPGERLDCTPRMCRVRVSDDSGSRTERSSYSQAIRHGAGHWRRLRPK